jgi:hypothetical protein
VSSHACPGVGCRMRVRPDRLACSNHWYRLPKELRDAVWLAWQNSPGSSEHMAAMAEAVRWYRENPS